MSRISVFSAPFLLGFDSFEERVDRLAKSADGYPPYNIERTIDAEGTERFLVSIAVAGFGASELEVLAGTDRLTGLYNRRKLDQILEDEVVRRRRYGSGFSLIMADLDHFKRVNDTHGHAVGDTVLAEFAHLLRAHTREADALARFGGEEFVIVSRHSTLAGCRVLAEKMRETIAAHRFPVIGELTASFGVAACREDDTAATLLARADAALYRAKHAGRNRVEADS